MLLHYTHDIGTVCNMCWLNIEPNRYVGRTVGPTVLYNLYGSV